MGYRRGKDGEFMKLIFVILLAYVMGTILGLWTGPWWYRIRSADAGDGFFMVKNEGHQTYSVWMVPSFLMFRESLKNRNRGKMFFNKLDTMLEDLKRYPPDSKFYVKTHQKVINWLNSKDQLTVFEPQYLDKRFYLRRKLTILNLKGPLFERISYYKVEFKFKACWTKGAVAYELK